MDIQFTPAEKNPHAYSAVWDLSLVDHVINGPFGKSGILGSRFSPQQEIVLQHYSFLLLCVLKNMQCMFMIVKWLKCGEERANRSA